MARVGRGLSLLLAPGFAACAASTLPYTPVQQPSGTPISADYRVLTDRLRIELDTGGFRVEDALIVKPDGTLVLPRTIEHPSLGPRGGLGVGIGVGGGWSSGGGTQLGTGVSVGTGLGGARAARHTFVFFELDEIGPPPWRVRVNVVGVQPVEIVVATER